MYYVYLLQSEQHDEIYVGSTNDLRRRLIEHNRGLEVSTKRYKPWYLVAYEAYFSEEDAREREQKLKGHGNAMKMFKARAKRSLEAKKGFTQHHFLPNKKNGAGFTLFEVLVYIGLFSIIMVGVLVSTFNILDSSTDTRRQVVLEQEAHFIFRKIDWALNGEVSNVSIIADGFRVEKSGADLDFVLDGGVLTFESGSGPEPLTASGITVSNLSVAIVPASPPIPKALKVSFVLDGQQFATTTRYIR